MSTLIESENTERRQGVREIEEFWQKLSFAQKVALNKLNRYGYQLAFARQLPTHYLAFVQCDNSFATIDHTGDVNMSPTEKIR